MDRERFRIVKVGMRFIRVTNTSLRESVRKFYKLMCACVCPGRGFIISGLQISFNSSLFLTPRLLEILTRPAIDEGNFQSREIKIKRRRYERLGNRSSF